MPSRLTCIRMLPGPASQYWAIQELIRPDEMDDLVVRVPGWMLPRKHSFADSVAGWLRYQFAAGTLRYIADPAGPYDYWCSPARTRARNGGDCDDLAILTASFLLAVGMDAKVVVGTVWDGFSHEGHAWVEGYDQQGGFLIEATTGEIFRHRRPFGYTAIAKLGPGVFQIAA